MQLGIFAKTFVRPTLVQTLDAILDHGLQVTQFNLACAGLPSLPAELDPALVSRIRWDFAVRNLTMAAVSGTYNMIHPDRSQRQEGLRRLAVLAGASRALGTPVITLCTGTRDPDNMWRGHPDNASPAAWRDLLDALEAAIAIAEEHDVTLGFEPEPANVIDSASRGRRLLDELRSPSLKVVLDAANLFRPGDLPRMAQVLDEAFALLGPDIVLAHAKDLTRGGKAGEVAAGRGYLDYDRYLALLHGAGYSGPLILHGLAESEVSGSVAFLRGKLALQGD
jgi:sugar phosphate isomerase/epimerase